MITTKTEKDIKLITLYTDRLGVHWDNSPKLLGHVMYDYMHDKGWYAEITYTSKTKNLPKRVLCATRYKAIRYMVMAEQRLIA